MSSWLDRLEVMQRACAKPATERVTSDFGELTWLRHLDDDLATLLTETGRPDAASDRRRLPDVPAPPDV